MKNITLEKMNYHKFFLIFLLVAFTSIIGTACVNLTPMPPPPCSDKVSIASNNQLSTQFAAAGDKVTVSLITGKGIEILSTTIGGSPVEMNKDINDEYGCTWKASRTMTPLDTEGKVEFTITIKLLDSKSVKFDFAKPAVTDDSQIITVTSRHAETSVTFDRTPPTIDGVIITKETEHGWYITDVKIHFQAHDSISGIGDIDVDPGNDETGIHQGYIVSNGRDVTIVTDGDNQSVTAIAIDRAGNTSEECELSGISINRIIVLVVDGWTEIGEINKAVQSAADTENIGLDDLIFTTQTSKTTGTIPAFNPWDFILFNNEISTMVRNNGGESSGLKLLLVGKSYGAAKLYAYLRVMTPSLTLFKKVALVLVDTHDPITDPGDEGDPGECYDYVCFNSNTDDDGNAWDLEWPDEEVNLFGLSSPLGQGSAYSKLRIYNIFERFEPDSSISDPLFPLGYSFSDAYRNIDLTDVIVESYCQDDFVESYCDLPFSDSSFCEEYDGEATHWNIANRAGWEKLDSAISEKLL
jgi:hypothetical protein